MSPYTQLLYQALESDLGIIVESEDAQVAQTQFVLARKAQADPTLARLSFTILEGQPRRLYIVKCPDEKQNLLSASTSGSMSLTSSGSETPTETKSE